MKLSWDRHTIMQVKQLSTASSTIHEQHQHPNFGIHLFNLKSQPNINFKMEIQHMFSPTQSWLKSF